MQDRPHRYVTTAIPYVNARPHVGFALEATQADVLARFYRMRGDAVRLQAGSDENSIKNVQAAEQAGLPVRQFVDGNAAQFLALEEVLGLSLDDFVRTSAEARHRRGVERLWAACDARGDIYRRAYRGLYCTGCEQFYRPADLPGGLCPEHGTEPEEIAEENWFFRLSRYNDRLRELYARQAIAIVPSTRRNEVLAWIDAGLEDFSISRSAGRARGWGIPVPGDPGQVIYVWFDALANYITALGYGSDAGAFRRYWLDAASREHVIGKGISRFHAVYWPTMLLSAGLPLPTRILIHGYVTAGGRKIGKSTGNAVDPVPLAAAYGRDALRYVLLRHIRPTEDGDFTREGLRRAYESELAGQLGNLAHRVLSMIERYCAGEIPAPPQGLADQDRLLAASAGLQQRVAEQLAAFAFDRALEAIWSLVGEANRYVTEEAPWALAKEAAARDEPARAAACRAKLNGVLFSLSAALAEIARCLTPLLPDTADRLRRKLGVGRGIDRETASLVGCRVERGTPLFPSLHEAP